MTSTPPHVEIWNHLAQLLIGKLIYGFLMICHRLIIFIEAKYCRFICVFFCSCSLYTSDLSYFTEFNFFTNADLSFSTSAKREEFRSQASDSTSNLLSIFMLCCDELSSGRWGLGLQYCIMSSIIPCRQETVEIN